MGIAGSASATTESFYESTIIRLFYSRRLLRPLPSFLFGFVGDAEVLSTARPADRGPSLEFMYTSVDSTAPLRINNDDSRQRNSKSRVYESNAKPTPYV